MILNVAIARQIVERTMNIIHYSVNVMDQHGRIIGSGDPSRLQQRHEGAILVLNNNRVVEIDEAMSRSLEGVKPGINLPIVFNQQVIGVVGISGEPALVRNYGELVKMTAELIVEQAALMSQIQWNKRHREELVLQLIQGSELNEQQLITIAERLNLDLTQPRIAAVVKVLPQPGEYFSLEHLQQLVHLLEYPERDNLVGIVSVARNEVVVLKPIKLGPEGWSREVEQKRVDKLIRQVAREGSFSICIALGDYFRGVSGLAQSYQTAKATLEIGALNPVPNQVLFYQDHIVPVLLSGLRDDAWRHQQLLHPLQMLAQQDPRGQLLKTLRVYFAQNCDLAQTCDQLHIHRNTLRYRLDKIEKITSLNFNEIGDKTRMYLALCAPA
ncbi:XRE family transcriptional regulator [Plesiomonas shigelloides]|uniref:sugar diacid recognition domain-containing protein n=1 Tax=Plesiomonas shigelloides TaxID=703 RepID=UPI0012617C9E|nr:sugar diacid recognition domain-containing protein [Plesiomonas shigelloides]KAB7714409.1 XRE family transcriptional regulator [Plesiomonas shigelloides]